VSTYRARSGQRVVVTEHDDGTLTVMTFGLDGHTRSERVTAEQFENAVINHGLCLSGEEPQ
jgi:methylmalonyl-CoA mutase cobalamin-binding subunit